MGIKENCFKVGDIPSSQTMLRFYSDFIQILLNQIPF